MKLRLLALALVVCGGAAAQNPYIALQGADETSGGIVVSQPRTVLAVDVTAERDVTLSGPYARYAQKFLGVRAPLTDKMSCTRCRHCPRSYFARCRCCLYRRPWFWCPS